MSYADNEQYDSVINKLRARGFKTVQDRRIEAEQQRKARLAVWEAQRASGELPPPSTDPRWWNELKALPGSKMPEREIPEELMTEEQKEEKRIREKWGGTLADSVPISDLKTISEVGYIPRSQSTCFRCGEKGHWSRDCPLNSRFNREDPDDILTRDRSQLRGRDARVYDKTLLDKREKAHYSKYNH